MTETAATPPPPDIEKVPGLSLPKLEVGKGNSGQWLVVWTIGLSGLAPFAVCLIGALMAGPDWDERFINAMIVYGALVATFSAGVRWGAEIVRTAPGPPDTARLARAAPPLVAGLAAILLLEVSWMAATGLVIATGLALLVWDLLAVRARLLPGWMGAFRVVAATAAIAMMIATGASVAGNASPQPATGPASATSPVPTMPTTP
jgi:hypothetical protein